MGEYVSTTAQDTGTGRTGEKAGPPPENGAGGLSGSAAPPPENGAAGLPGNAAPPPENGAGGLSGSAAGLPAYRGEDATAPASTPTPTPTTDGFPAARLPGRRAHALGVCALVVATLGFGVPLWGEIRARVHDRVGDVSDGAIGIGTGIAWSTSALANIVTLGVLGALMGVLGTLALRHLPLRLLLPGERQPRQPGGFTDFTTFTDFTALRRAYTLGWIAFVLAKLVCWSLARLVTGGSLAWAVPSVTHLDAWLPLLSCALLLTGRAVGASWPRAAAVAAVLTTLYATALWSLPS
ncbi:hypothetical protein [Streptomyces sp. NPDC048623]|uniref:hypothetical protein n=1 Tax=Streptomyces sp. NPDC048623 TaxID=3155761 RepID=UPI00342DD88F